MEDQEIEESEPVEEPRKVSRHEFYFETPLYSVVNAISFEDKIFSGEVDAYNSTKGFETTYTIEASKVEDYNWSPYKNIHRVTLTCKRAGDNLVFFVHVLNANYQKVGQFPSSVDIQFAEIGRKYDKLLTRSDLQEFKRAIGLAAYGVGVGSFVYLRRIFENLIKETYEAHKISLGIEEEDFLRLRMDEKVEALKLELPSQLVEMKGIYKVLSDGVHNLTEEECLSYFPALKLSIELILEQKIESETRTARDLKVKEQVATIANGLGKSGG